MAYTPNYGFQNPTPGDPAVLDAWGTIENTGRSLVDSALGGGLTLSVAGAANVVLTNTPGIPDQSRNAHYILTGILTGNIQVLWPQNAGRCFSVLNSTTGAFTLGIGANNGAGVAGGTTVTIPQGVTALCYSDGTNVTLRQLGFCGTQPGSLSLSGLISASLGFSDGGSANGYVSSGFGQSWDYGIGINGAGSQFNVVNTSQGVSLLPNSTGWAALSDETEKTILRPIKNALDAVATLRTVIGTYNSDETKTPHPFLIAQDVLKVLPEAVGISTNRGEGDPTPHKKLMLHYTDVIPLLTAALKEALDRIRALENKK